MQFTYSFIAADLPVSCHSYATAQTVTFDSFLCFVVARCHPRFNLDCKYRFTNLAPNGINPEIRSHIDGITRVETENMGSRNLTPGSTQANLQIKYALSSTCKINPADELLSRHQNSAMSPDCLSIVLGVIAYDA